MSEGDGMSQATERLAAARHQLAIASLKMSRDWDDRVDALLAAHAELVTAQNAAKLRAMAVQEMAPQYTAHALNRAD